MRRLAARLPALPGMDGGLMEVNGPQQYARWDALIAAHPDSGQPWMRPMRGAFHFDESFYAGGGLFHSAE